MFILYTANKGKVLLPIWDKPTTEILNVTRVIRGVHDSLSHIWCGRLRFWVPYWHYCYLLTVRTLYSTSHQAATGLQGRHH